MIAEKQWCDGCQNRRPCITRKSGVIYEGKDCEIHLCHWCRGHETRSANAKVNDGETEKITERDTKRDTKRDTETAEEKVAWLKILLCTKSCDPVFTDYWLRLARRNLLLGLPLTTPEPDLNLATEEFSATDHFRDATKMVSGESSAPTPTQPQ